MRPVIVPPEIQALLDIHAPVAIGVSGGKDSHAVAWALANHLRGYQGPKVLIHSDLGSVEWLDSRHACQRIAQRIGWELVTCRRKAGGMMQRWESRWQSSRLRYCDMRTVAVVLPWSTASMRFCTSELKVDPITTTLKRRFGKVPIINVTGVRADESAARARQAVFSKVAKLPPGSLSWSALHDWQMQDVWDAIAESGVAAHEAYTRFGSGRVSCRFCILANEADLRASLRDPEAIAIYRRMCDLELTSAFTFQGNRWLSSLAPELIDDYHERNLSARWRHDHRRQQEAWIPKRLQFTKGWPHCVPTMEECERLAEMRMQICASYGWHSPYVTGPKVRDRYQELWDIKQSKLAS